MKLSARNLANTAAAILAVAGWQAAALQPGSAQEAFPSGPIEILVPWGPGGGASTVSQVVEAIATENELSPVPITITHKPGASGLIGTALVSERKGNPHVFLPGGGALLVQEVVGKSPVDPLTELTPLALSAVDSSVVIASADSPYENFGQVIAQLEKEPKSVTMGGAGGGPASWDGMLETVVGKVAGVEFNQIPFSSGAEVLAAVLGGQVDVGTRQLSNALPLIESGELKALVIFDEGRNPALPDVPTMKELGFDVVLNLPRGWFGPPGLSEAEVEWYGSFFKKVSETPGWREYIEQSGLQNRYLGPREWTDFVDTQMADVEKVYRDVGVIE